MKSGNNNIVCFLLMIFILIQASGLAGAEKIPLSILYFEFDTDSDPDLSWVKEGVPDYLYFPLQKSPRIRLVERNRIKSLMDELSLGQLGIISEEDAANVGKYVGARYNVLGRVMKISSKEVVILANVVDVQTSEVVATEKVQGNKSEIIPQLLDRLAPKLSERLMEHEARKMIQGNQLPVGNATQTAPEPLPPGVSEMDSPLATTSGVPASNVYSTQSLAASAHFYQASHYLSQGKWELAVSEYYEAIKIDPQFSRAYVNLGAVYLQNDLMPKARDAFLKALDLAPNSELGHFNLGAYYGNVGDFDNAIAHFEKALQINPDNSEVYVEMGKAYYKKQQFLQAKRCYQQAIAIDDYFVAANYYLGILYRRMDHLDSARFEWQRVIVTNETYFKDVKQLAYKQLGDLCMSNGQFPQAVHYFEKALEIELRNQDTQIKGNIYLGLGRALLNMKNYEKALVNFTEAGNYLANNPELHYCKGVSYYCLRQVERAIAEFQTVFRLDPNGTYGAQAQKNLDEMTNK